MNSVAMSAGSSTLEDLRKAGVSNSRGVVAAIDAYMRQPASRALPLPSGHRARRELTLAKWAEPRDMLRFEVGPAARLDAEGGAEGVVRVQGRRAGAAQLDLTEAMNNLYQLIDADRVGRQFETVRAKALQRYGGLLD